MRRINRKLVLFSGVGVLVFGAGVHGLHAVMVDRNAGDVLLRAEQAEDRGDSDEAARLLSQYLRFRPDDLDVLERHALLLHRADNPQAVARRVSNALEKILREDPSRVKLRKPLSEAAMTLRRFADAEFQLDELLRIQRDDAELVRRKAAARAAQSGRSTRRAAAELYLAAIALDPRSVAAHAELAALLQADADALPYWDPVAKRFLEPGGATRAIRANDADGNADQWTVRADAGLLKLFPPAPGMTTAASAAAGILDRMVSDAQPPWKAFAARAQHREANGDSAGAAEDIGRAFEHPEARHDADLLMLAATVELAQAQTVSKDDVESAEAHRIEARRIAQAGVDSDAGDPRFYGLLADAELARDVTPESLAAAEAHLREGLKQTALELDAANAGETGRLAETEIQLRMSLASLMISRGENEANRSEATEQAVANSVREEVQKLREAGCRPELIELIEIRILGLRRDWDQAARRLESLRPQMLGMRDMVRQIDGMLGVCYVHLRNPDRRLEVFRRAVSDDPGWTEGRIALAEALAESGRIDEALAEYKSVSGSSGVPRELARLALRLELRKPAAERNFEAVESLVAAVENGSQNDSDALALRIELLAAQQKFDAVEALAQQHAQESPDSASAWMTTFNVALIRGDWPVERRVATARERIEDGERRFGDSVEVRLARAELERVENPKRFRETAIAASNNAEALAPADRIRLYEGLIASAARAGDKEAIKSLWKKVVALRPDHLAGWLAIAQAAAEQGDQQDEETAMREIRRIEGPNGPNGDFLEAIQLIGRMMRNPQTPGDSRRQSEIDTARRLLAQAAERRPYWPAVPRALAMLETFAGDSAAAFEQYRRARDLGDLSPEVIRGLIAHHGAENRWDLAAAVVDDVERESPGLFHQADLARLKGVVALKQGDIDGAIAAIDQAGNAESVEGRMTHAYLLSMKYRNLAPEDRKGDIGRQALDEATESFRRLVEDEPHETRAWTAYVAHLVRIDRREDARNVVADAEKRLPAEPVVDRLRCLAQCYQTIQESQKAADRIRQALEAAPDDPVLRLDAASLFAVTGDLAEANRHLEWLLDSDRVLPAETSARARRLRALTTASTGRYEDHRRAVESLASTAGAEVPIADLRAQVAMVALRRSLPDRRELISLMEKIRDRSSQSPENAFSAGERFALASLYQQTNQWSKARPIIEELLQEHGVDAKYTTALIMGSLRDRSPIVNDAELESDLTVHLDRLKELESETMRVALTIAEFETRFGRTEPAARALSEYVGTLTAGGSRGGSEVSAAELTEIRAIAGRAEELNLDRVAEDCFRRVAANSPNPNDSLVPAMYLGRHGRYDEALAIVEARPNGTSPEAAALAAVSIVSAGQPSPEHMAKAETIVNEALQKTPGSARAMGLMAGLRMAQGRYEESEAIYRQILAENPADVSVLNNLAWLLVATGKDPEAAEKLIGEAIAIAGPVSDLVDTRGVVLMMLRRPDEAVNVLRDEFENGPSPNAALGFHLAMAYLATGRPVEARKTFTRAKELGLGIDRLHATEHQAYKELARRIGIDRP